MPTPITGTITESAHDAVTYDKWVMENAILKGWLIGAMETSVMNFFIRLPTTKSIWEALLYNKIMAWISIQIKFQLIRDNIKGWLVV